MATIPKSNGLYRIFDEELNPEVDQANTASTQMTMTEAHCQLGHISPRSIQHMVQTGMITGVDVDTESKPDFCELCAKAKSNRQLFPQASLTRANKFGERVHWDLWGPAAVKSLAGNLYVTARIDDASRSTKLYFQANKTQTIKSYKTNEAYVETHTRKHIKYARFD
jgi:hypothetical protein